MCDCNLWICSLEEVGAFDNFKDSLIAIRPALTGIKITGQIAGGTSGDLKRYRLCWYFYNPIAYGFMPFKYMG